MIPSASVLMINNQGIMISVAGNDYFLSYNRVPWLKDATVRNILNIKMSGKDAVEWPDLDVDLEVESLKQQNRRWKVGTKPLQKPNGRILQIFKTLLHSVKCGQPSLCFQH